MPSLSVHEILSFSNVPTSIFVETGTFQGDTVNEALKHYKTIYSIELSDHYYALAKRRFATNPEVNLLHGDSSVQIESLCKTLNEPTFFWLDGHYSSGNTAQGVKDCPLHEELQHIVKLCKPKCVIAIDDVRLFGTKKTEDWSEITVPSILGIVSERMESINYFPSALHPKDRMIIVLSPLA